MQNSLLSLNFLRGAEKTLLHHYQNYSERNGYSKQESSFLLSLFCSFLHDSTEACVTSMASQVGLMSFFLAYRCYLFLPSSGLVVTLSSSWYAQPALQFLTIIKKFRSGKMCLVCDPRRNGF